MVGALENRTLGNASLTTGSLPQSDGGRDDEGAGRGLVRTLAVLAVVLGLGACAGSPGSQTDSGAGEASRTAESSAGSEAAAEDARTNDPLEPVNRAIFDFNLAVDKAILRPAARGYELLPDIIRDAVRNFLRNLRSPVIVANDLMQGEVERAGDTMGRFIFNTLIFAGLFDPASEAGVPYHDEDFGQTLAVWGADSGPYLMLPLLGPSNLRDTGGMVADKFLDPMTYWADNSSREWVEYSPYILGTVDAIDMRSRNYRQLEDLEATSLDFYAAVRSLYRQQRRAKIENREGPGAPTPGLGLDAGHEGPDTDATRTQTSDVEATE